MLFLSFPSGACRCLEKKSRVLWRRAGQQQRVLLAQAVELQAAGLQPCDRAAAGHKHPEDGNCCRVQAPRGDL